MRNETRTSQINQGLTNGFIVMALLFFCSGCCWLTDCECVERFDYEVPSIITQPVFVEPSFLPTYLNGVYYPNGVDVFYFGNNLFYTMVRSDQQGNLVRFYWDWQVPSPFSFGQQPPFHELLEGERIEVVTLVNNLAFPDIDCFSMDPPVARTQLQSTIRTEAGEVVTDNQFEELASVPAGQARFVKHPFEYIGKGEYELRFIVDFNIDDLERDTTNNRATIRVNL